jgi:hypothetical protein
MTCAHRLLVRFRHDGSFARVVHGLLILVHDWTKPSRSPPRAMRAGPRSEETPEARYRSGQSQREPGDRRAPADPSRWKTPEMGNCSERAAIDRRATHRGIGAAGRFARRR